jgi:hypothetical protein
MKLLVKFPTRGRKEQFFSTFNRFHDLAITDDISFLVSIDRSDEVMNSPEILESLSYYVNTTVKVGESSNKIDALNRDLDAYDSPWDIVILAADDTVPCVLGYDKRIIDEMKARYPDTDGVLFFNDGFWGRQLNTQCILGKKYYERFGYIYHPGYNYVWCDNDFMQLADLLGKQTYFDQVIIKHEHPSLSSGKTDIVHVKNEQFDQIDKKFFEQRKSRLFDIDRGKKIKIVHLLMKPLDGPYGEKQKASMDLFDQVKEYVHSYTQQFSFPYIGRIPSENCADPSCITEKPTDPDTPWLSQGHYGAYLSHRRAVIEEFSEDLDALLVIEGDVIFNIKPADFAFRVFEALEFAEQNDASLFTFGHVGYGQGSDASRSDTARQVGKYKKIDHFVCAHCYMITKKERSQIQHKLLNTGWHAWDIWLYWNYDKRVPIFSTPQPLVYEPEGFSMIDLKAKEINVKV